MRIYISFILGVNVVCFLLVRSVSFQFSIFVKFFLAVLLLQQDLEISELVIFP